MRAKQYETANLPIPPAIRRRNIVASAIFCVFGVLVILANWKRDGSDNLGLIIWGGLIVLLGVVALVISIKRTHEPQLPPAGKAAKTDDDGREALRARKRDAAFFRSAITIAVLTLIIYAIVPLSNAFQDRIAVYPIVCHQWSSDSKVCLKERADKVTTFTVKVPQQLVVGITEDAAEPDRLFNCTVADIKNWSCALSDEKFAPRLIMRDGNLARDGLTWLQSGRRYTTRLKWWTTKLGED
jgi:hypothetical protein